MAGEAKRALARAPAQAAPVEIGGRALEKATLSPAVPFAQRKPAHGKQAPHQVRLCPLEARLRRRNAVCTSAASCAGRATKVRHALALARAVESGGGGHAPHQLRVDPLLVGPLLDRLVHLGHVARKAASRTPAAQGMPVCPYAMRAASHDGIPRDLDQLVVDYAARRRALANAGTERVLRTYPRRKPSHHPNQHRRRRRRRRHPQGPSESGSLHARSLRDMRTANFSVFFFNRSCADTTARMARQSAPRPARPRRTTARSARSLAQIGVPVAMMFASTARQRACGCQGTEAGWAGRSAPSSSKCPPTPCWAPRPSSP